MIQARSLEKLPFRAWEPCHVAADYDTQIGGAFRELKDTPILFDMQI